MTDNMSTPLTPADCDLRDFPFIPLEMGRLFGSEFHARATDAEWRAGVTLWLKSFHQVPAASLPDDDVQLARLAELANNVRAWKKVRIVALHGWEKSEDGRLYHPVVAEKALEAWIEKLRQRKSSAAGNAKRYNLQHNPAAFDDAIAGSLAMLAALNPQSRVLRIRSAGVTPASSPTGNATGIQPGVPPGSQETGTGKRQGSSSEPKGSGAASAPELFENAKPNGNGVAHPAPAKPKSSSADDLKKRVYDRGKELFGTSAGGIITNILKAKDHKYARALALIEDAGEKRDPVSWINAWLWEHGPPGLQIGPMAPAL